MTIVTNGNFKKLRNCIINRGDYNHLIPILDTAKTWDIFGHGNDIVDITHSVLDLFQNI